MLCKRLVSTILVCLSAAALQMAFSANCLAQAWVPPQGEGSLTTTYQKVDVKDHFDADGDIEDRGRIHTHNLITTLEYGITDKLALDFELAYVSSKFVGLGRRPHGPVDDGLFHPTFSDARVGLRYNVASKPLVLTPFVSFTIPTHDYEVRGHSAVGRGFHELVVGINAGRELGPLLPKGYAHLRFSYALLKRFAGLNLNHANAEWEAGWLANRVIVLRFIGAWQKSQGGFEFPAGVPLTPAQFAIHDRVARADYVQLGGGVTFSVNKNFDIHTAYAKTVSAKNTHGDAGLLLGFTWRFSTRSSFGRIAENTLPTKSPALVHVF